MNVYLHGSGRTVVADPGGPVDRRMASHRGWSLVDEPELPDVEGPDLDEYGD